MKCVLEVKSEDYKIGTRVHTVVTPFNTHPEFPEESQLDIDIDTSINALVSGLILLVLKSEEDDSVKTGSVMQKVIADLNELYVDSSSEVHDKNNTNG